MFALLVFLIPPAAILAHAALSSPFTFTSDDLGRTALFVIEAASAAAATSLLRRSYAAWRKSVAIALAVAYVGAVAVQFVSYHYTLGFLPRLALENTDNARILLTPFTFGAFTVAALYATAVGRWIRREGVPAPARNRLPLLVLAIPLPFVFSAPAHDRFAAVPSHPPVTALVRMLMNASDAVPSASSAFAFTDVDALLPALPDTAYPLVRDSAYSTAPIAGAPKNVVVIFMEGVSARMVDAYDGHFPGLMPNVSRFIDDEKSLRVDGYFNHTAATFHGLLGQLCSLYPATVPHAEWEERAPSAFRCLPDLFDEAGYRTVFLDPHYAETDHLHAMLERLGFDEVRTGDVMLDGEASRRTIAHEAYPSKTTIALSDADLFDALEEELARDHATPRFIALYPFGTHAWRDVPEDGARYDDGRHAPLNTAHDLDAAFGAFWDRFRASDAYGDTVFVLTSDHARFHEAAYLRALVERGVTDVDATFTDRIPFVIHDPRGVPSARLDARGATSIDFAPTIAHYLGLPNGPTPWIGTSLFERDPSLRIGLTSYDDALYLTSPGGVSRVPKATFSEGAATLRERIQAIHALMREGRIWPKE